MNFLILKQLAILSAFAGVILGFITVIPYISAISFFTLILFLSAIILVYLKQNDLIADFSLKEGGIYGALIGFVSFIAFSIIFSPISMLLGWLIPSYTQGFMKFFVTSFGSFVLMIFFILFTAGLSALFNAFSGLVTAYVYELLGKIKKDNNRTISVDFRLK